MRPSLQVVGEYLVKNCWKKSGKGGGDILNVPSWFPVKYVFTSDQRAWSPTFSHLINKKKNVGTLKKVQSADWKGGEIYWEEFQLWKDY